MIILPLISLLISLIFIIIAYLRRKDFRDKPYHHWFIYLNLAAVGMHQFEEYGWPRNFREVFAGTFNNQEIVSIIPSLLHLEFLNTFVLITIFALTGWYGTRVKWIGIALLFLNFSNGFFHLVFSVTQMIYVPGVFTGTLVYMPLCLFAVKYAIINHDVDKYRLLLSFYSGTIVSFAPFIHVWLMHILLKYGHHV